jgi:hypothetical protein
MNQCLPAHSAIAGGISMTRRMVFGRCFENALGPYFRKENRGAVPGKERETYRDASLVCK